MKSVMIDGVEYVEKQKTCDNFYIIRTCNAGVFAGEIESRNGQEAVILNSRRIWYWDGAASLSQLAVDGTSKPENCKFPCIVGETILTDVIEIIKCTEKAKESLLGVKVWEK